MNNSFAKDKALDYLDSFPSPGYIVITDYFLRTTNTTLDMFTTHLAEKNITVETMRFPAINYILSVSLANRVISILKYREEHIPEAKRDEATVKRILKILTEK